MTGTYCDSGALSCPASGGTAGMLTGPSAYVSGPSRMVDAISSS